MMHAKVLLLGNVAELRIFTIISKTTNLHRDHKPMEHFDHTTALAELIGIAGFGLYVLTYSLLTFRVIRSPSLLYFAMNLTAASCVLIGLSSSFNLASAMIQIFWISMSLIGIMLHLRRA
jgi:uncharacterized membrane protein